MSAAIRRRLSVLEGTRAPVAPQLLIVVARAGTEGGDDHGIVGIDGDGTRPALDRVDGESVDNLIDRAKAQIVGGGFHIIRFRRST